MEATEEEDRKEIGGSAVIEVEVLEEKEEIGLSNLSLSVPQN